MHTTTFVALAMAAALLGGPAIAGNRHHDQRHADRHAADARGAAAATAPWQAVPHEARPGEPGHGWSYFFDPVAPRAVVISPQGDYYYSRGKGLRWIAGTQERV